MKVVCIKNYDEVNSRTTIGKIYELYVDNSDPHDQDYFFVADNGDELWYHSEYFITLEQWRDNQLNKILT